MKAYALSLKLNAERIRNLLNRSQQVKNVGRIENYTITREWNVSLDGKSYQVRLVEGFSARKYDQATKAWVSGKQWLVYGGGYSRRHLCDDTGATHKRVVTWMQTVGCLAADLTSCADQSRQASAQ